MVEALPGGEQTKYEHITGGLELAQAWEKILRVEGFRPNPVIEKEKPYVEYADDLQNAQREGTIKVVEALLKQRLRKNSKT